jgi:tetratricopeptide (TPR) repeat protein
MKKSGFIYATVLGCLLAAAGMAAAQDVPEKVMSLAYEGVDALDKGHYDQAITLFTGALQLGPAGRTAVRLHANRGKAYFAKGDNESAIKDYDEAVRLDPNYAAAFAGRADAYNAKGDMDKALADYTESIRLDPKYAPAYVSRAVIYNKKGLHERAIADSNTALALDPQSAGAQENRLAGIEGKSKRDNADAFVARATRYRKSGMYEKAAADFNSAIQIDPNYSVPYNELAWLLATCPLGGVRDGKKAVECALHACELSQWDRPWEVDTLAAAYAEAGDFDNAVKYEQQYLATAGLDAESRAEGRAHLALYQGHEAFHEQRSSN